MELTSASEDANYLCITYNTFDLTGLTLKEVNLDYHLRNIVKLILIGLLPEINRVGPSNFAKDDRHILFMMIRHFFTDVDTYQLKESVESVKNFGHKAKEWWNKLVNPIETLASVVLMSFGLSPVDIAKIEEQEYNLGTHIDQLKCLQRIAEEVGYSSICILIDKVDENDLTGSAILSYTFIEPLLKNLSVFELKGFAFKLFLWDKISIIISEQKEEEKIRLDRIQNRKLRWNRNQLKEMLSRRLSAYSNQKVSSLNQIFQNVEGMDWDEVIITLGLGSPRTIIRICKEIFEQQSEINSEETKISLAAINRGVKTFCENYAEGLPDTIIRELLKNKRVDFATNYIASDVYKFSQQAAISKIKTWLDAGLVEKIGELQVTKGNRPSHHFGVTNVLVAKHIFAELSVAEFLEQKIRYCKSCGTPLIREWNIKNEYRCHECQEVNKEQHPVT